MFRSIGTFLIAAALCSGVILHTPVSKAVSAPQVRQQRNQKQRTRLIQQTDYYRRRQETRKATLEQKQVASVADVESSSARLDYIVLVILLVSVLALIVMSKRAKRSKPI